MIKLTSLLSEEDKQFTNPLLNKKVKYVDKDGESKENLIGNLLRLAKNHPGRLAAEKMLPKPGTKDRKTLNRILGREKQGGLRVAQQKLGGGKDEPTDVQKEPQQPDTTQLFKSDPAVKARLNKEKEVQKKLLGKDKVKNIASQIKEKISDWSEKDKEFFKKHVHKGGSPERRSWGEAIKDKAKGAWAAIKHGLKHEAEEVKNAGLAMKNLVTGQPLSNHQSDALKAIGKKVVTTALFGAAMGGLEHGLSEFAQHVAVELVPHTIAEVIALGSVRAAINAGDEEMDKYFQIFIDKVAEQMENMKISPELMQQMVDSYNEKRGN